jgi:hypothetical protein
LAIIVIIGNPGALLMHEVQAAARTLGLKAAAFEIRQPEDIAPALDATADDWGTGLAGWNAKASGRSKSDGRHAKKHSASGDRGVGHMHFLPGWSSMMNDR